MRTLFHKEILTFVIEKTDIDRRFDVNYYKPEYREIIERLRNSPFEIKKLGDIVSLSRVRWKKPNSGTFKYIEIGDIDTTSGKIFRAKELSVVKAPSRAQLVVKENDIIVSTTRPYRGAIALVTEKFDNYVCTTGFSILRNLKMEVNRKYLLHMLRSNFGLIQMQQRMTGGNYPAILPKEILKIWIPYPSIKIQDRIAQIMDEAIKEKEQKIKESEYLFNSIDNYILHELGITSPEYEKQSPLIYEIGINLLKIERWDVEYWKKTHRQFENSIKKGKFQTITLSKLIKKLLNGLDYRNYSDSGTKYLRVSNIKPFEINWTDIKYVPLKLSNVSKDILLEINDILLTRKGTFGIALVVDEDELCDCIISSEIFRLVPNRDMELNSHYLVSVLNSVIGTYQFSRKSIGAIMGSLSQKAVRSLLVPLPPKSIQDEIAFQVKLRISRSRQLQNDAEKILDRAKFKIERIILGDETNGA